MPADAPEPLAQPAGHKNDKLVILQQRVPALGHGKAEAIALTGGLHGYGGIARTHKFHLSQNIERF